LAIEGQEFDSKIEWVFLLATFKQGVSMEEWRTPLLDRKAGFLF
jgi:hypothetical protein